jgi:hypothetical protein
MGGERGRLIISDCSSYPEVEVTKIILAKVSRFCLLSSLKHGYLSDLRFINP